jgi:hypothetical protein
MTTSKLPSSSTTANKKLLMWMWMWGVLNGMHAVAIRDIEMNTQETDMMLKCCSHDTLPLLLDKTSSNRTTWRTTMTRSLHLFIPSKFTCMLILLLLRFLWKPSPSLPLSKKRQSNSATYQEQSSSERYLLQQFLYVYDSEDMCLLCVCLLHLAADWTPKWAH